MRPLAILYGILLRYFETDQASEKPRHWGICVAIIECYELTPEEIRHLKKDFLANRPSMNKHEFFFNPRREKTAFWWDTTPYGVKIRMSFIKHMIRYHETRI